MSGFRVIAYGAYPLGALMGGLVGSIVGLRATFFIGAAVIGVLLPYLVPITGRHGLGVAGRHP